MSLRVGIVGAGRMGRERGRAAVCLGARVVAVCDLDLGRAAELASELRADPFTDLSHPSWKSLDALFVCTPPASRTFAELLAIRDGIALFVEKPVGVSAEQSLPLLQAIRDRHRCNAVGYTQRYRKSVQRIRKLLSAEKPLAVAFHWLGSRYRVPWWLEREQSGGPLNEQCTHFVDLCRFLIGEITEVQALARRLTDAPDVDGTIAMTLRFRNGAVATGLYACDALEKQLAFEVFLATRSLRLEGWDLRVNGDQRPVDHTVTENIFVEEVAAFFAAIRSGDPSLIQSDFEDAMNTQVVVDTIGRAVRTGRAEQVIIPSTMSR